MSTVPFNDVSPGSMHTLVSRHLLLNSDPATSKRVCFYKSGDPQFTGHRMVINSRTFKTFDALLDALSKKVPLSFGVRTITTPKGTHAVRTLDDLQDGASYLCSDRRKVKPFNLDEVHKTQVPWNTRPVISGHLARRALVRQLVKRGEGTTRAVKMPENSVVVRTPKRLTVYKNKDPSIRRVIVLQRRTAPNFEALLDYLSKVMRFPVLKLFTEDGRKVDGLPALILCSGIVVAAGNEPFRMGTHNLQASTKTIRSNISKSLGPTQAKTLLEEKNKPSSPISRSRNFSLSSERYLVEQINKSLNGSLSEHNCQKTESMETEDSQPTGPEENCDSMASVEKRNHPIMPTEDDIEKSFRVNEDGSMTVEMKVHLTIKQEEMVHWTTTLSRSPVNNQQRAVGTSKPGSGVNSLDVANDSGKESNGPHGVECKEINSLTDKSVGFIEEERENYGKAVSQTSEKLKPIYRRLPTPGHRQQRKETSISETGVHESTVGAYSYMERTAQGELMEGYCVVSRSSSSSTRDLSKPRKSESGEIKQKKSHSFRSSGVADVLQLKNNRTVGITEAVLHIYESQDTCDNYYANTQVDVENKPEYCTKALPRNRPSSTDSGPRSSSNDCDVDLTRQSTSSNSGDGGRNDLLSLSSASSTPSKTISNNPQILSDNTQQASGECRSTESTENRMLQPIDEDYNGVRIIGNKNANTPKSKKSKQSTSSESSGLGKRIKGIPSSSKGLQMTNTSDTLSHTESEKKTQSSAERAKHNNGRDQNKKTKRFEGTPKSRSLNLKRRSEKELKTKTIKDISHKVNTSDCVSLGPTLKSNVLDNRSPAHPEPLKKMLPKQRSMNGTKSKASTQKQKLSESLSLPVLQSSPSNVNQYVENWLQKIQPDSLPYDDNIEHMESVPRVVCQIGSESADGSEIKSEPEKDSVVDEEPSIEHNAVERPSLEHDAVERHAPVQIRCEGEALEAQRLRGFCKSMPSVRVLPAEQESHVRMHKSSENLAPPDPCTGARTSQSTEVNTGSGVKPVLKQLCLSIQSIRRASSQTHLAPTVMEKSSSLPDFSSQVVSAFGSPTRAFLSFLSLMTLRDGKSLLSKDESQASSSEAMQVMQSLEKISNITDEEELKASWTSLQRSTSSRLKQSWRDFQERNLFGESPPLSPRQSEQEFALDVDSGGEGEEQDEEHDFGIEQLMDELNMSGDIRREISSLVEGDLKSQTNLNNGENDENEDGSVNGSFEKAADMEMEKDYCEENVGLENDTTKDEITDDPKKQESREQHVIQSHSPDLEQDLVNEDSDVARPTPEETPEDNCSNSSKAEVLETADNNQINTETERVIYGDSESRDVEQSHFQTSPQHFTDIAGEDLSDKQNNMSEGENNITADIKDVGGNKEEEATILPDDNTDDISKQKVTDLAGDEQFSVDQGILSERDNNMTPDNLEVREPNEEQGTIQSIKEPSEQSDVSEPDVADATSEQKVTDLTGDEQFEFSDGQDIVSERENNTTPDDLEEEEANEEQDTIQSIKEHSEQSDVSEPDVADATSEQKVTDLTEQFEFSDGQGIVSERENNTTPDDLEERDNLQNLREHSEQSDVSEREDDLCLASETECVEFPDKETELNELNEDDESQFRTGEIQEQDCVREETDHSDFEEDGGDEEEREDEENKSIFADCDVESQNSQHSLSHHCDAQSQHTVDVYESGSQEDDEVMSPDVEHAMPEMSESENLSCPERCNNVENSKTEDDETQHIDDSFMGGRNSDDEDHEVSEHCKWVDPGAEAGSSRNSDPEVKNVTAETSRSSMSDSEHVCKTLEEDSHTDKNETPAEFCDQENRMPDSHDFPQHSFMFKDDNHNFAEREACSSMKTNSSEEKFENLGMEHGYHYLLPPTEISQELLDLINSALLSSTLTVKYDSNGNLRIEPDKCNIREMFRAQHRSDDQYGEKPLLSPYTSDLSDYRPETSNNSGLQSQASMELLTESDDEEKRLRIFREVLKQSSENPQNHMTDNSSVTSSPSTSLNSNNSLNFVQVNKRVLHEPLHYNKPTSHHRNTAQCVTINGDVDSEEGVLIDKGRWLLKENHLIRKSPPMPMGMYGNGETTSPDTGLDNMSEDAAYPQYENQAPLAVISSSELEDLAKPCTPKCMYFNMSHSSGSDLLSDAQSLGGRSSRRNKELKVSPMGESSKMWAKKNGSLSSFASVEFKLPDGKVHPQDGPVPGAVNTKTSHSIDSRTMQEEESRVGLNLRCGQHCPIL